MRYALSVPRGHGTLNITSWQTYGSGTHAPPPPVGACVRSESKSALRCLLWKAGYSCAPRMKGRRSTLWKCQIRLFLSVFLLVCISAATLFGGDVYTQNLRVSRETQFLFWVWVGESMQTLCTAGSASTSNDWCSHHPSPSSEPVQTAQRCPQMFRSFRPCRIFKFFCLTRPSQRTELDMCPVHLYLRFAFLSETILLPYLP